MVNVVAIKEMDVTSLNLSSLGQADLLLYSFQTLMKDHYVGFEASTGRS